MRINLFYYSLIIWITTISDISWAAPTSQGNANAWTLTPSNPPAVPLAVRSPYLSCWLPQGSGIALNGAWPTFWTGSTLGWAGYIRVDGTVYNFLGEPGVPGLTPEKTSQKSINITSTQSIFVMTAGPVDLTVTFLSPVEPTDLVKQSLPLSYLALSAVSTDGNSHNVQVYTDISAEWVSGDNSLKANWTTISNNGLLTHQVQLTNQQIFKEISDHSQYGSVYYSTLNVSGLTYQTGEDIKVRGQFINSGILDDSQDTNFRAIEDDWPVFAFSHDLGEVSSSASSPVVVSVGHVRDPVIEYIIADDGTQSRSSYFWTQFSTVDDAISFFLNDFENATARAIEFDSKVFNDANAVSSDYASLVPLSIRQTLGATELTVSQNPDGSFNTSDVLMFMKEISSDGNVNTVDVIFPSWPLFMYTNPTLGKYLLQGLFEYQASGQYPNLWSIHDLGSSYPKALGHNDGKDEAMPIEESGNMVIMTLSYTQATNDTSLISNYYELLDQWTQFLTSDSLVPGTQISTDDFAGPLANQTNLAIKGIVGIKAMSIIAQMMGDAERSSNYSSIASSYVTQWQKFATSSDGKHLTLSYGNDSSWGLAYNLYADKLLGTSLFPQSVYDMQTIETQWYSSVATGFGVPLDTRHTYTKSDWQIWTAGLVSDKFTRDLLVGSVLKYVTDGANAAPLSDWYETSNGKSVGFKARPVVGGHLALLLVDQPTETRLSGALGSSSSTSSTAPKSSSKNSALSLRGAYFGLIAAMLCSLVSGWMCL